MKIPKSVKEANNNCNKHGDCRLCEYKAFCVKVQARDDLLTEYIGDPDCELAFYLIRGQVARI